MPRRKGGICCLAGLFYLIHLHATTRFPDTPVCMNPVVMEFTYTHFHTSWISWGVSVFFITSSSPRATETCIVRGGRWGRSFAMSLLATERTMCLFTAPCDSIWSMIRKDPLASFSGNHACPSFSGSHACPSFSGNHACMPPSSPGCGPRRDPVSPQSQT